MLEWRFLNSDNEIMLDFPKTEHSMLSNCEEVVTDKRLILNSPRYFVLPVSITKLPIHEIQVMYKILYRGSFAGIDLYAFTCSV